MTFLEEKVKQVEAFYAKLDVDLSNFQSQTKYSCLNGCSKCCNSPHIEASVLEMLPFAFFLFKENLANDFYDKLLSNQLDPLCILHEPVLTGTNKGACSEYQYRALVCRLFGFSFVRNKLGDSSILACKDIKTEYSKSIIDIENQANSGLVVPMANIYYTQLSDIDYNLSLTQYPINEAIKLAIEMTMTHFYYAAT